MYILSASTKHLQKIPCILLCTSILYSLVKGDKFVYIICYFYKKCVDAFGNSSVSTIAYS